MSQFTIEKFYKLPESVQKQVIDFIEFLLKKYKKGEIDQKPPEKRPSHFGSAKGVIIMSDDFDEPLEDFKDYQ